MVGQSRCASPGGTGMKGKPAPSCPRPGYHHNQDGVLVAKGPTAEITPSPGAGLRQDPMELLPEE